MFNAIASRASRASLLALVLAAGPAHSIDEQSLHFVETESTLELTVPAGGVWLIIPREGFERLVPAQSGAPGWTFDLVNEAKGVEIFGTFDAASRYPGIRLVWAQEVEDLRIEEAPTPRNVRFSTEGDWEVVHYEIHRESELTRYVRAATVKGDVWIDVQIEVSGAGNPDSKRDVAVASLRGLGFRRNE